MHRKTLHDCLDLIQGKTISASRIAVAKSTGEIAFVGESEADRDACAGAIMRKDEVGVVVSFIHSFIHSAAFMTVAVR